ncbi:NADH dehydrogenase [ubiquinone] 1 beta subcomplex subunit 11, mitochondrial [Microplitis mediator]|uniref:NADH dehydrogenase [ubiquinone] 1 beta subcomplex subunit 11, mitochondrial n=1 Tax=Microplitis mediator TaxID=375433 RepID=UPI002556C05D|nr:NADH dehydrogenase [ubiquinone] 1 beta subcomplex subunit 11, mitochondrial [Microplitis mediator]
MANLVRLSTNQLLRSGLLKSFVKTRQLPKPVSTPQLAAIPSLRFINTSSKPPQAQSDTSSPVTQTSHEVTETKHWISWGFHEEEEWLDRMLTHANFFFSITLIIVGGGFIFCYLPDPKCRNWAQREAYLVLRYREDHGLKPIERNLIDPSKFTLPTDEELGDTEVII